MKTKLLDGLQNIYEETFACKIKWSCFCKNVRYKET